jgi:cytochrome c5
MSIDIIQRRIFCLQVLMPALALLVLLGAGCSEKETTSSQEAAQAPALQFAAPEAALPAEVAESTTGDMPPETQTAPADGRMIFQTFCHACHIMGIAGAPKLGDKVAWKPRIAKGGDALLSSVKNGLNAMPPNGACANCSDDQLRLVIEYMIEQGS